MKKSFKKIIILILAIAMVISTLTFSFAQPVIIHERRSSEIISSGVIHEHIQKFTDKGWWNINILRIDLNDKYTEIKPIFSNEGMGKRERLSKIVGEKNAIAGINGDFFASFNYSSPLGIVVVDGEIISTVTEREKNLPTIAIDENNQILLSYWTTSIKAIIEGYNIVNIRSKNKASSTYNEIRAYDSNWNKQSFGNSLFTDMVEVVIDNNEVIDVRYGQPPIDIPINGYILVGRENAGKILLENFHIGNKVELQITSYPNYENIKAALGGGAIIVRDGVPVKNPDDIVITGEQPRTAIGITRDRSQLLLLTIDGRHTSYKGVSQETLAETMVSLGAYEAINLDGGGSTTMVVNPISGEGPIVVNNPSDGGERKVSNGLGVFNYAPNMPLDYIKIYTGDINVFAGTTREFFVKGYDEHHNPVEVNNEDVVFSIENNQGKFADNILHAEVVGEAIVKATYAGKVAEAKVNILAEVKDIELELESIHMDFNSQKYIGEIYGVNNEGFTAKIDYRDINWHIVGDIGYVRDGIIYSDNRTAVGYITATVGSALDNILVSVGYNKIPIHSFDYINDIGFTTYPQEVLGHIELINERKEGNYSLKLSYDFTQTEETRAAYVLLGSQGVTLQDKPNKIGMWVHGNKSNHWLRGKLVDSQGAAYNIDFSRAVDWEDWKWVTAEIPSNVSYPVKLERIYLVETDPVNKDVGEILIDDLNSLYTIPINNDLQLPKKTTINDPLMRKSEIKEGGYKFVAANGIGEDDTLLKQYTANETLGLLNKNDFGIIMGNLNNRFDAKLTVPNIKVNAGYGAISHKNTLFMKLDDSKNGLRATDYKQWIWLKDKLNNSTEKNLVVSLPKEVFGKGGFIDKLEAQLLDEVLLEQSKKGKNIFVITGGGETEVEIRSGIRYIKLKATNLSNTSDIYNLKYISFVVNGDEITYEILPLFPISK